MALGAGVVEPYFKRVGSNTGVDRKPRGVPYYNRNQHFVSYSEVSLTLGLLVYFQ